MLVNPILLIFGLFLLGVVICFYIVREAYQTLSLRSLSDSACSVFGLYCGGERLSASGFPIRLGQRGDEKADAVCRFSKTAYPGGMRGFLSGVPVHRHRLGNSDAGKHRL